ncbi:MAG: peptidoglycan DD-metalloendopeptidase family protein [Odoribacteraceae bacterium]|jgi:murein DD-endopeptidase MepM/ murein hydrolase activator NlpD|nr:peptidoglycan DD-metalloendopeptidase family protein [Odoribacteraceae bacterium]
MKHKVKWIAAGIAAGIAIAGTMLLAESGENDGAGEVQEEVAREEERAPVQYKYGIPVDDLEVEEGVVEKNRGLSVILESKGVPARKIREISGRCEGIFDARKIRAGNKYAFLLERDSARSPAFFVYERDATDFVVVDFKRDEVYAGKKAVETRERTVGVKITSSAWRAMQEAGENPELAVALADIYAWTIDFHGVREGDSIRVIYEQPFAEGAPLARFDVKGAIFTRGGKKYLAVRYPAGDRAAYFDEQGNNLQKAFLKSPLRYARVSSRFSNSRFHPILKIYRPHHGVDYAAPAGTPVHSIGDGTVVKKDYQGGGGGNYVTIRHNGVYSTTYMHLAGFAPGIRVGARVAQGSVIGYVGNTGLSTNPHLDFRVFKNGKPVNPLAMESPSKEPVAREEMERFGALRDSIVRRLASV